MEIGIGVTLFTDIVALISSDWTRDKAQAPEIQGHRRGIMHRCGILKGCLYCIGIGTGHMISDVLSYATQGSWSFKPSQLIPPPEDEADLAQPYLTVIFT